MIRRIVTLYFIVVVLNLAGGFPLASRAQESYDTGPTTDCQFIDWQYLDFYTDHVTMASAYLHMQPPMPHKPALTYAKAVTFKSDLDSLSLDAFLRLSPADQQQRKQMAINKRERVARFYRMILLRVDSEQTGAMTLYNNINNKSVTDCIHALVNATGLDPSSVEAWYDLSYFSRIVGDRQRSLLCLKMALGALKYRPADTCHQIRQRLTMDYAWLCRDLGLYQESLEALLQARELGADEQQVHLLEGLAMAGLGEFSQAMNAAQEIGEIRTRDRHLYSTRNKHSAYTSPSNYAERWVEGMAYFHQGEYDLAYHQVKDVSPTRELPHASRFWNDVGLIYELAERPEAASMYGLAIMWLPYLIYYPVEGMRGAPKYFSDTNIGMDYTRSYRSMYVAGSLFSYAGITSLEYEVVKEPLYKDQLARFTLDALETCRRRHIRPTEAVALRGRFLYARGDYAGALVDLRTAITEMAVQDEHDADLYLLAGISSLSLQRYQEATVFLGRTLKLQPDQSRAWNLLGVARIKTGNRQGAMVAFDRSIVVDPEAATSWYNRGLLQYRDGNYEASTRDLQMATLLQPGIGMADELLSEADVAQVDFEVEDAKTMAQLLAQSTGSQIGQRDTRSLENGLITLKSGNPQPVQPEPFAPTEAEVARLESIYAQSPSAETRQALARAYIRAGRAPDARQMLTPFWGRSSSPSDQTLLLEADRALGDTRRAQVLASSLEQGPPSIQDPAFWSLVAFICLDAGLKDEGMAALDAAISLDPTNLALKRHKNLLTTD